MVVEIGGAVPLDWVAQSSDSIDMQLPGQVEQGLNVLDDEDDENRCEQNSRPNESSRHASQFDGSPEQTASFLLTGSIAHRVVFGPERVLSRRRMAPLLSTPAESIADSPSEFNMTGCVCVVTCCCGASHMHPPRALHTPQSGSMMGLTSSGSSTQRHSLDD